MEDIFKKKKENQEHKISENEVEKQTNLVEYKQENVFKRIINKILSFSSSKRREK